MRADISPSTNRVQDSRRQDALCCQAPAGHERLPSGRGKTGFRGQGVARKSFLANSSQLRHKADVRFVDLTMTDKRPRCPKTRTSAFATLKVGSLEDGRSEQRASGIAHSGHCNLCAHYLLWRVALAQSRIIWGVGVIQGALFDRCTSCATFLQVPCVRRPRIFKTV